jgi:hypothetical protein
MKIKCPHCGKAIEVDPPALMGSMTSEAKAAAARENGKKGGWPKGKPRKPVER